MRRAISKGLEHPTGGFWRAGSPLPELEYNLGNAHLKAGRLGGAVFHYRRALKVESRL